MACMSIKPRRQHQDLVNPYFTLLHHQRTPLERLLAQNQKIISLEPFFVPGNPLVKVMQALLELDVLHRLAVLGLALARLRKKYQEKIVGYDTDAKPDFSRVLVQDGQILVPFGTAFFALLTSRIPHDDLLQGSLLTATIGGGHLIFYPYERWDEQAKQFKQAIQGRYAADRLQRHLAQALVLAGILALYPAGLLLQDKSVQERRWAWRRVLKKLAGRTAAFFQSALFHDESKERKILVLAGIAALALVSKGLAGALFTPKIATLGACRT